MTSIAQACGEVVDIFLLHSLDIIQNKRPYLSWNLGFNIILINKIMYELSVSVQVILFINRTSSENKGDFIGPLSRTHWKSHKKITPNLDCRRLSRECDRETMRKRSEKDGVYIILHCYQLCYQPNAKKSLGPLSMGWLMGCLHMEAKIWQIGYVYICNVQSTIT